MVGKLKIGDNVEFRFAGCIESGVIIEKDKTHVMIDDGHYKYPVKIETITKKLK